MGGLVTVQGEITVNAGALNKALCSHAYRTLARMSGVAGYFHAEPIAVTFDNGLVEAQIYQVVTEQTAKVELVVLMAGGQHETTLFVVKSDGNGGWVPRQEAYTVPNQELWDVGDAFTVGVPH